MSSKLDSPPRRSKPAFGARESAARFRAPDATTPGASTDARRPFRVRVTRDAAHLARRLRATVAAAFRAVRRPFGRTRTNRAT
jgi:hypothetical protein